MKQTCMRILFALMALLTLCSVQAAKKVHMLGDSTMAPYDPSATITRGWGMYFGDFLTSGWTSINYALGGRDARSGYNELWLTKAKANVEAGDYVIIQFAHNDEMFNGVDHDELVTQLANDNVTLSDSRGTNPSTTYKTLIGQIVDEVKALGATPILVGPACRFWFTDEKIRRTGTHDLGGGYNLVTDEYTAEGGVFKKFNSTRTLPEDDYSMSYNWQMQQLATAKGVPYIDLTTATKTLYESYGSAKCAELLQATKSDGNGGTAVDGTHFRTMGALLVAKECAQLIAASANADLATLKENITIPTGLSVSPSTANMGKAWTGSTVSQEFTINGFDLTPAEGNITVSATGEVELSKDGETWTAEGLELPYAGGTIVQNIYARATQTAAGTLDETVSVVLGSNAVNIPLTAEFVPFSGGEPMSVNWPLASSGDETLTGEATYAGPTLGTGVGGSRYKNDMFQVWGGSSQGSWSAAEDDDPNRYVEFSVTAPAGKALDINNIAMKVSAQGTNSICCHVYYSTDDFNTRTTIYAPVAMTSGVDNQVSVSPVIQLAANQTVKVRVYPWSTADFASGKYIGIKDVVISGQSKADETPVTPVTISYSLGNVECEGTIVPEGAESTTGASYTIPKNYTLYKEGYTLTGWTDGTATYNVGKTYTLTGDMALTPVFTENTVTLNQRTTPVTATWNLEPQEGVPAINITEGQTGIRVTQVTVGAKSLDLKLAVDNTVANANNKKGKLVNKGRSSWCQSNQATKFTIPSCKGAKVSMKGYAAFSTTTIDGNADYTSGNIITDYEIGSKTETIDIILGAKPDNANKSDCEYMSYISVILPEVAQPQEKAIIDTDFQDWEKSSTTSVITTAFSKEQITFTYEATSVDPTATNESKFPTTTYPECKGYIMSAKSAATVTTTAFSNITKVRFRHGATGNNRGWGLKVKGDGDADWVTLSTATVGSTPTWVEVEVNRQNVQLQWYNLNTGQNAYMFELEVYSKVVPTADQVTLTTNVSPANSGTIKVNPAGNEFDKDTEVTVTATKNFGYKFVEWQNAEGSKVSDDDAYTFTISENTELKAVFEAVPVYTVKTKVTNDAERDLGSITLTPNDHNGQYEAGTKITATANELPILKFLSWTDENENKGAAATRELTINSDMTLVANYEVQDFIAAFNASKTSAYADRAGDTYPFAADATWDANRNAKACVVKVSDGTALRGQGSTPVVRNRNDGAVIKEISGLYQNGYRSTDIAFQYQFSTMGFTTATFMADMTAKNASAKRWKALVSLDNINYEPLGDAWDVEANKVSAIIRSLPAEAIGKETVWVRITGEGTDVFDTKNGEYDFKDNQVFEGLNYSTNAQAGVGNVYILGDAQVEEDTQAPAITATIPADNATGVSASGKITISFDERIETAGSDGAVTLVLKGGLGGQALTPTWNSRSVSFDYKNLDYDKTYSFNMPANYVQDKSGNKYAEAVVITFTTMARPVVDKADYDAVVSTAEELAAAIKTANTRSDQTTRYRIFIKKGTYKMPTGATKHYKHTKSDGSVTYWEGDLPDPITYVTGSNISFIGEDRDETIITQDITNDADMLFAGQFGTTHKYERIGESDVLQLTGSNIYMQDITVKSGIDDALGRNLAVHEKGNHNIYKNVKLWGYQDTWTSNADAGILYFEGGVVRGRTDYLCGKGDAYFNGVELLQIYGGYPIVPSISKTANAIGWVFKDCTINGTDGVAKYGETVYSADQVSGSFTLGRPWGNGTPTAYLIDTKMNVQPKAIGWDEMSGTNYPKRFAEYNSMNEYGAAIDLSGRKTDFGGQTNVNNPILTADEAAEYGDMSTMFGDWQPTLLTEQAPVPTNVVANAGTITWDDSSYALLWAVCKDGKVVAFTTAPSYVATEDGEYAVRAANEMGGLSAMSLAVTVSDVTGIPAIHNSQFIMQNEYYDLQGRRVTGLKKGINIVKMSDGTIKKIVKE